MALSQQRSRQNGLMALLVAAAGAAASPPALGELVIFENAAGEFAWSASPWEPQPLLDVSRPAGDQTGDRECAPNGFGPFWFPSGGSGGLNYGVFETRWPCDQTWRIGWTGEKKIARYGYSCDYVQEIYPVRVYTPGEAVRPGDFWHTLAHYSWYTFTECTEPGSVRRAGAYLGVEIELDDGKHYGWIELGAYDEYRQFEQPVRWAYESVPGRAALIPGGCRSDCDQNGKLNINDFVCFQIEWAGRAAYGDFNGDGKWNINDFVAFQADFRKGCP